MIEKSVIQNQLAQMGVRRGAKCIVHSSYKAIGEVQGGPAGFLEVLLSAVGDQGTVLMPVFNDPLSVFDLRLTHSECGVITEMFRKIEGTVRSFHPSHSVAVWGKGAKAIAQKHETATALGVNSPLHELIRQGADIYLIGVGQNRNSAVHVAERVFGVPYCHVPYNEIYGRPVKVLRNGQIEDFEIKECPGCSEYFGVIDDRLAEKNHVRFAKLGNAPVQIVNGMRLIECVVEMLKEDVLTLLCDRPQCSYCPRAREAVKQAGASPPPKA